MKISEYINDIAFSMNKLFNDNRFKMIWSKIFTFHYIDDRENIFYKNYEQRAWREKNKTKEESKFGQEIIKIGECETEKMVFTKNEIFPHTFCFTLYHLNDKRERVDSFNYFLSITEYSGYGKILLYKEERPIFFGKIIQLLHDLEKELDRDPNEPLWIIWYGDDPRARGDYYREVYESISFIGYKDEAFENYECIKRNQRWGRTLGTYHSYPSELKENEKGLSVGYKRIIHEGREEISREEMWEIQHGY